MSNVYTYEYGDSLYINLTNACTNRCDFCIRNESDGLNGNNLWLDKAPSAPEIIAEIPNPSQYPEIVFCGYGEPTMRLFVLKEVAQYVKENGGTTRLNTNGHGNIINKRDIVPELRGLIDIVSVSLNAGTEKKYNEICNPGLEGAFDAVVEFIEKSVKMLPKTIATIVKRSDDNLDIEAAGELAKSLGAEFRVRHYQK